MHEPADIDGELLRLRSWQKMAVVQRVQEARFGNPSPLLDDDAVHDRDLSGRPAEAEQGDAQPDLERLAETDAVRRHDLIGRDRRRWFGGRGDACRVRVAHDLVSPGRERRDPR